MAWRMALLGNTMAHGGQASVETHKGGSTGHPLTKNGASGWLCRRPALPSAVGSIGIEPTADGPWRRLSGAQLGTVVAKRHLCWNGKPMSFLVNN